ncbi:enoyl-CoA hydratase/isomerase family protein [Roseomonas terrae]|uniref:Enoyl-CoA hydratase/isomerase family protein n=1 Tax=Neoroseomonas terrae TaxID=424799 RepID=A0ABS5EQ75_9PROT|nr:enoyl-CoA hydratase/isomerase family protein [Neoroseomonas terrae]MBR0653181.1 enoyl-CoA hydratase/isomerase family protein [Neoroseomonas terrae]
MSWTERYQWLRVEIDAGVATVTMNRPEARNAMIPVMRAEIERIWLDIAADEHIDVVLLTGAGDSFSAGGDVKAMAARAGTEEGRRHAIEGFGRAKRMCQNMLDVPQAIIAAVNGDAMGLGATLALIADVSVMADAARIGDSHVKVGLVAGDGGTVFWPLLIGPNRAKEFLMRSRIATGAEAASFGLVNHAVPKDEVLPMARAIATELASQPKWAVRWTKLSVNAWLKQQLNMIIDASHGLEMLTAMTWDHGEAARAFAEERRPHFRGE